MTSVLNGGRYVTISILIKCITFDNGSSFSPNNKNCCNFFSFIKKIKNNFLFKKKGFSNFVIFIKVLSHESAQLINGISGSAGVD